MIKILNLTQHPSTPEQKAQGVVDLQGLELLALKDALTFTDLPSPEEIRERAAAIAAIAASNGLGPDDGEDPRFDAAMVGGAPYLMAALEAALKAEGLEPLYAFSRRETVEEVQPDGSVRKVAVFRHAGWVPVL